MLRSRVRTLSEKIIENAKHLKINESRINYLSDKFDNFKFELPRWDFAPLYPNSDDFEEMCKFYLIFNSINYCYFNTSPQEKFKEGKLSGSALAATRLTENWKEISDPIFLSHVDENYLLSELFFAEDPLSLIPERVRCLREVGKFLNENSEYPDLFYRFFCKYRRDAYLISQALPTHLPLWSDPFYKRAQLFVGMVYGRFQDKEDLSITPESLENLTVFADYRVPQTLMGMGVIDLSEQLRSSLYNQKEIQKGSREELELRAATIVGSDKLEDAINKNRKDKINSLHVDFLLWSCGRKGADLPNGVLTNAFPPHHRTFTTDY